jgi:superfamily I DNA/RNA helicase
VLTTFTEKAAKNLQDRLSEAFLNLAAMYPQLADTDPSELRIGTLHGLCNDILQEYRYTAYQNLRLLDEVTSALLLHKSVAGATQAFRPALFGLRRSARVTQVCSPEMTHGICSGHRGAGAGGVRVQF